jgi:hypothetical protein
MEGCQHNTMDVEYYGPNPQMGFLYLCALRGAEEMALARGEKEFARRCHALFESGSRLIDETLFNGEYYEHVVRPPKGAKVAEGLRWTLGARDLDNPELQLGSGCLVDQLFGQYFAHITGLGYLAKPENIAKALASIFKFNFKRGFKNHFNHMRSYVLNDESALLMASYPHGNRPQRPFPYFNEVMTGFEYTAAVGMIYENALDEGLLCIEAIRSRVWASLCAGDGKLGCRIGGYRISIRGCECQNCVCARNQTFTAFLVERQRLGHVSSTTQRELHFVLPHGS